MKVRCDKCHVVYDLSLLEQKKETKADVLIRYYLKCPICGFEADVMYENNSVREMRKSGDVDKTKLVTEMSKAREEFLKGEQENGRS